MPVEEFNDGVHIHGTSDQTQLEVRGPAAQTTEPLQEWQDPSGVPLSQITADGRLEIGDPSIPSALVQANDEDVDLTGSVKRGVQTRGKVAGTVSEPLSWSATELEFSGTGGVGSDQAAQRVQIVHDNSGDSSNADLRAGEFEAINKAGASGTPTGILTGVHIGVTNESSAHLNEANALKIEAPINNGTIAKLHGIQIEDIDDPNAENYALHTGAGLVHLGDVIELAGQLEEDVPHTPHATGTVQLYAKDDGKLYAYDGSTEMDLTGSGSGLDEKVAVSGTDTVPGYLDGKLVMGSAKLTKVVLNGGADEDLQLDVDPSQIDLDELGDVNALTPSDGQALTFNSSTGQWEPATLAGVDEKVSVSANDTTPDYLLNKLAAGAAITLSELNNGANEDVQIAVDKSAIDLEDLGDVLGNYTQGDVLYFSGTNWEPLDALSRVCEGRLTLVSNSPLPPDSTVTSSTLYFTPFNGNKISLYEGTNWVMHAFTQRSLSLSGLSGDKVYDIFIYDNSGTLTLQAVAWTNYTTRATSLAVVDHVYVKGGAYTHRYLGTIYVKSAGQAEDSNQLGGIWNYYNQMPRRLVVSDGTTHTYTSNTTRSWNIDATVSLKAVFGLDNYPIDNALTAEIKSSVAGSYTQVGWSMDSNTAMGNIMRTRTALTQYLRMGVALATVPGQGVHDFYVVENRTGGSNTGSYSYCQASLSYMA